MAKLTKSIRKDNGYSMGGVIGLLVFPTFLANGITPSATFTKDVDGQVSLIALDISVKPVSIESEDEKASFTGNLVTGTNKYIAHGVGLSLAGLTHAKNISLEDLDLERHTVVARTKSGKNFIVGPYNGLISTQNNSGALAGLGDLEGYDVVLGGGELCRPIQATDAAWAALSLLVPADVAPTA